MLKFSNDELAHGMLILGPESTCVVKGLIKDQETDETHEAAVVFGPYGIEVRLDGYGEKTAEEGQGDVVFVEFFDGKPQADVFANINVEGPTHQIDLSVAREDALFEEEDSVEWCDDGVWRRGIVKEVKADDANPSFLVKPNDGVNQLHHTTDPRWLLATQLRKVD